MLLKYRDDCMSVLNGFIPLLEQFRDLHESYDVSGNMDGFAQAASNISTWYAQYFHDHDDMPDELIKAEFIKMCDELRQGVIEIEAFFKRMYDAGVA